MQSRFTTVIVAMVASLIMAPPVKAEPRNFILDPEHLTVSFLVDHVGFAKVLGVFREVKEIGRAHV